MQNANCRLYAITPPQINLSEFTTILQQALSGGDIACLQIRLKNTDINKIKQAVRELMPICHAYETAVIVNDNPELAAELNTDGVHLGQEDLQKLADEYVKNPQDIIAYIKEHIGPDKILGITCHASSHLAMEAGEQGADYVAFGAFYPTNSKPQEKLDKWGTPSIELLRNWAEFSVIPSVAIGGITASNCAELVQAGADFIAAITGIWNHPKGAKVAVAEYNTAIKEAVAATNSN